LEASVFETLRYFAPSSQTPAHAKELEAAFASLATILARSTHPQSEKALDKLLQARDYAMRGALTAEVVIG
jgi:hypothetical protein